MPIFTCWERSAAFNLNCHHLRSNIHRYRTKQTKTAQVTPILFTISNTMSSPPLPNSPPPSPPPIVYQPHPPWHPMYATHASTVSTIRADFHAAANERANIAEAAAASNRSIESSRRFQEAAAANADDVSAAADSDSIADSVSSQASFDEVLTNLSARMWGTPALRPTQSAAIAEIMHGQCAGKLLLVHRTGGGKSHIMRMIGSLVAGITVVIVPLLTLCADQIRKILEASQKYASCEAHHIDDCSAADIKETIVPRIDAVGNDSSSSVFLFISPQKLVSCGPILAARQHGANCQPKATHAPWHRSLGRWSP